MKRNAAFLGLLLLLGSAATGCSTSAPIRSDWESTLAGGMSLTCHNLEHIGYGIHQDIIFVPKVVTQRRVE